MRKTFDNTFEYCMANDLKKCIENKFHHFFKRQFKNVKTLYLDNTPIERVDTFKYPGVRLKHNNTFQTAMKHNTEKARKALFKLEMTWLKVAGSRQTKKHFSDHLILPIGLFFFTDVRYGVTIILIKLKCSTEII